MKIDCHQLTYSVICYLVSEILLLTYGSLHLIFISCCAVPFSSPAIPTICKILKLRPFGILSVPCGCVRSVFTETVVKYRYSED